MVQAREDLAVASHDLFGGADDITHEEAPGSRHDLLLRASSVALGIRLHGLIVANGRAAPSQQAPPNRSCSRPGGANAGTLRLDLAQRPAATSLVGRDDTRHLRQTRHEWFELRGEIGPQCGLIDLGRDHTVVREGLATTPAVAAF